MRKPFPIKSKKFGERLNALMKCNGLGSLDLAVKLLGHPQKPKSNTPEYQECRAKEKTIKNHLKLGALDNQNSSESLSSLYLIEYCNFFHCEADFLLGYIDFPTKKNQSVYEITGLSENAIEALKIIKRSNYINTLNFIMRDYALLGAFLSNVELYLNNKFDTPVHFDDRLGIFVESKDVSDSPILISNSEKYMSIGKKLDYEVAGQTAFETISVPVSILESHALHCIQQLLDNWKKEYKKGND